MMISHLVRHGTWDAIRATHLESWLLRLYVSLVTTSLSSFLFRCMKSNRKAVMAKKIQFMMPNAKLAFRIAHSLLVFKRTEGASPLMLLLSMVTEKRLSVEKLEQSALAMLRSS